MILPVKLEACLQAHLCHFFEILYKVDYFQHSNMVYNFVYNLGGYSV